MYQIYVPGAQRRPDLLDSLGLGALADSPGDVYCTDILDKGPDSGAGLLIDFNRPEPYVPGQRQWIRCARDKARNLPPGRFYWGLDGQWPEPSALRRKEQVKGTPQTLGDGRVWVVPNMLALPHRFTIDDETGDETREIAPDWKSLYDRMYWAFEVCQQSITDGTDVPETECRDYLAEILAVNYRVNLEIVRRMRLITDDNWCRLFWLTVDYGTLLRVQTDLQKKSTVSNQLG